MNRSRRDDELNEEIASHLRMAAADRVRAGASPSEAEAAARREFGNVGLVKEITRAMWGGAFLERVGQDFKYGWRQLRRAPAFTSAAVLTLALGIGATAAVFSALYSVVLRPLPYANAERIVDFNESNDGGEMNLTFGAYADWRTRSHSFQALGATRGIRPTLTGVGEPVILNANRASADYWKAVYAPPALGRYFTADEDRPGGPKVAVLSYPLWNTRFAADSSVLGKTITLSGVPFIVIGVASPAYNLGRVDPALWTPFGDLAAQFTDHSDHELQTYGVLKPGVTLDQAVNDVSTIEMANAKLYPHSGFDGHVKARFLASEIADIGHGLFVLFAAVACVLLIGCVNIANLLLSRGAVRSTELAVRAAMGAGRGRVVLQLLNESLLLALIGAAAGVLVAFVSLRVLRTAMPSSAFLPRLSDAAINLPVIGFTLLLALGCGVLFGLVPSLRASKLDLQQTLRSGGRGTGARRDRLRSALVVVEVGLAQALLVLAGLLIHSAIATSHIDTGIQLHDRTGVYIALPGGRYPSDTAQRAAFGAIQSAVSTIPGVHSTAYISQLPVYMGGWDCTARPEGSAVGDATNASADFRSTSAGYFKTIGIPLLEGRDFNSSDIASGAPVAIINQSLARKFFGTRDPIGNRVTICVGGSASKPIWRTVIGVVGDVRSNQDVKSGLWNDVYMPMSQFVMGGMTLVAESKVAPPTVARAIREKIHSIDPLLPVRTFTLDEAFANQVAPARFSAQLYTALASLALILAAVGIYGVIAYFVTQRTREIGIRMALGAHATGVIQMIVRQGVTLAVIGLAIGLGVALLGGKTLASDLYGVSPRDPVTFIGVSVVLLAVAVVATLVPARRATRIDPLLALRE